MAIKEAKAMSDIEIREIGENSASGCDCCRHKERSPEEYKDLVKRLNRVEGQIRGIKGMLDKDAYCIDILTQVAAATSALNSFSKVLLANHIKSCVEDDVKNGSEVKIDELIAFLPKMMK
ncbi:MAG: metal-sensing transcriptional repressor [Lachnospiraceae bacterium]|nr:metal-sensing transcriptional repressor [Lachnospiraceae bacterium]